MSISTEMGGVDILLELHFSPTKPLQLPWTVDEFLDALKRHHVRPQGPSIRSQGESQRRGISSDVET
jgi:hypothetical protein